MADVPATNAGALPHEIQSIIESFAATKSNYEIYTAFDEIAKKEHVEKWVRIASTRYARKELANFNWPWTTSHGEHPFDFSFYTQYPCDSSPTLLDRNGLLQPSGWNFDMLNISVEEEKLLLKFRCAMTLDAKVKSVVFNDKYDQIGRKIFYYWFALDQGIAYELLGNWMNGRTEHPVRPYLNVSSITDSYLEYHNYGRHPMYVFNFFKKMGTNAFDMLFKHGCVHKEVYDLVTVKLQRLGYLHRPLEATRPSQIHSLVSSKAPETTLPPAVEAVKVLKEDRERLEVISKFSSPLTNSQWAELLGFSRKTGAFYFLKRMESEMLLKLEKRSDGTVAFLTPKGKRIIEQFRV